MVRIGTLTLAVVLLVVLPSLAQDKKADAPKVPADAVALVESLGIPGRFDDQHDEAGPEPNKDHEYLTEGDFE